MISMEECVQTYIVVVLGMRKLYTVLSGGKMILKISATMSCWLQEQGYAPGWTLWLYLGVLAVYWLLPSSRDLVRAVQGRNK